MQTWDGITCSCTVCKSCMYNSGVTLTLFRSRNAGVTMTLFCTHSRVSGPNSLLDHEVIAPCGYSVSCQFGPVVRRHGRGVLLAGGDPCMTGCLECPLASPVFAQSWSQTATDGAWYSTTALLSGRD